MAAEIEAPNLSPRVARILDIEGPPFGRPVLKREEVEEIRAVVRAVPQEPRRLNLSRALFVLFDNDPSEESAELIGRVLADPQQEPAMRRQAAAVLGQAPTRSGTAALVEALAKADAGLEHTILTALVNVGDVPAADAIAKRPATARPRLAGMRRFARAAILVREGQAPDGKTETALFPSGRAVELEPLSTRKLATLVKGLRGALFGVTPGTALGFELVCGETRHAILFDAAFTPGKLMAQVMERGRVAGIVAMEDPGTPVWTARNAVYVKPCGDAAEVAVVRPNGTVALSGRLTRVGEGFTLHLRDVTGGGLPMELEGTLTDKSLRLRTVTFDDTPRPQSPGLSIDGA